ncbi:hypothetical protein B7P33_11150 [Sediminicola luteus]|uniref:TonB-dependent receptor plug domain-containing protein n=2 Tax=Sediminicola luteus TaxID=319238 RepID=A0A2A4G4D5_9FLAO|nr:hypothetical protein B7P33_11150 [Sediminicola luteus]
MFSGLLFGQTKVSGTLTTSDRPLSGAKIENLSSRVAVSSNVTGDYSIQAKALDTLRYSYVGKETKEVIVAYGTQVLNLALEAEITDLDNVEVADARTGLDELRKAWVMNKDLFRTSVGYIDQNDKGIRILQNIPMDSIDRSQTDLARALAKIIDGRVYYRENPPFIMMNPKGHYGGRVIYDVDGLVSYKLPLFLDVDDIDRVSVLAGPKISARYEGRKLITENLANHSRKYGVGVGAIMVINTKRANKVREKGTDTYYDFAKRRDNAYNRDAKPYRVDYPDWIRERGFGQKSVDLVTLWTEQKEDLLKHPYQALLLSRFVTDEMGMPSVGKLMVTDLVRQYPTDVQLLLASAYVLDAWQAYEESGRVYKMILGQINNVQSIKNVAQNADLDAKPSYAANCYAEIASLQKGDTHQISELDSIVKTEVVGLYHKNKKKLGASTWNIGELPWYLKGRLLLEWSDPDAEFELELVNPNGQTLNWNHSSEENAALINQEKIQGLHSKQFIIDNTVLGPWQVNLVYLGNKSGHPTYFKLTSTQDFGTKSQKDTIGAFMMIADSGKIKLTSFSTKPLVSNNGR